MSDNKKMKKSQNDENSKKIRVEPEVSPDLDFINNLNDDCLPQIFKHLSVRDRLRVQRVCNRWRNSPKLVWGDMSSLDFPRNMILRRFKTIQETEVFFKRCGSVLRDLKFGMQANNYHILPLLVKYCPDLQRLQIRVSCFYTCPKWVSQMQKLEYLNITGHGFELTPRFFEALSCVNLTELELTAMRSKRCFNVKLAQLSPTIFARLPKLSSLSVKNFLLTDDVLTVLFRHPNLKSLSLFECRTRGQLPPLNMPILEGLEIIWMDAVTDDFLFQMSENCKNLRYLTLGSCRNITENGFKELKKLPELEEFHLSKNENITDEFLSTMHKLKRLTCLDCSNVQDEGIIALMKHAPNLEYLEVQTPGVTQRVLVEANEIVKERSNDLVLRLVVYREMKKKWKPENMSPLLVV